MDYRVISRDSFNAKFLFFLNKSQITIAVSAISTHRVVKNLVLQDTFPEETENPVESIELSALFDRGSLFAEAAPEGLPGKKEAEAFAGCQHNLRRRKQFRESPGGSLSGRLHTTIVMSLLSRRRRLGGP